ncbi:MAG: hypothetical protein JWN95_3617 [Frankiales bacterium]|nr:hypothetical protein [Frankiales bacterium]
MAVIRVRRGPDKAGVGAKIEVTVDGQVAMALKPGKSGEVKLAPGEHTVQATMDWLKSPALTVTVVKGQDIEMITRLPWRVFFRYLIRRPVALVLEVETGAQPA